MSEDNVTESSLGVENLSLKSETPLKPAEIVKSLFSFQKSIENK